MADVYDESGNRIPLTDELGNPVRLTDEHGRPMHLTGVATAVEVEVDAVEVEAVIVEAELPADTGTQTHGGEQLAGAAGEAMHGGAPREELRRSGSSSSSSSEDNGQGGRRKKKKGLREKIKEILPLPGKHKDERKDERKDEHAPRTESYPTTLSSAAPPGEHRHEHEKKGIFEKIKEKLPGTGHHSNP